MVKTMAWRIARPSASSSSSIKASARTPMVASSVVARIGVSTKSACEMARETSRDATFEVHDHDAAVGILLLDGADDLGFPDVGSYGDAWRRGRPPRPDRDRAVRVTIEDDDFCPRMREFGAEDDGSGGFPEPPFGDATVTTGIGLPDM